jgi:putative DNA primase/helicase
MTAADRRTRRAPCPQCDRGPRDTALAITIDERGTVTYCHRCGYTAAEHVERLGRVPPRRKLPSAEPARLDGIWRRTLPLAGSIGETYLLYRHCVLPPPDSDLRFLPGNDRFPPSLCALVTDTVTAEPISLHFTRLRADGRGKAGTDRDKLLLKGHRKAGGVIRLWPSEAVSYGLGIAEGIETALAASHIYTPIWAAIDAGNLAAFPVLPGIDCLTIYADHDDAGLRAARECGLRWKGADREVRILRSVTPGQDIADVLAA